MALERVRENHRVELLPLRLVRRHHEDTVPEPRSGDMRGRDDPVHVSLEALLIDPATRIDWRSDPVNPWPGG
jgi:hypothetical protein